MKKVRPIRAPHLPFAIFFVLVAGIIAAGFYYHERQVKSAKGTEHDNLAAIADLKAEQITRWRNERRSGALSIQNSTAIAHSIKDYFEKKSQKVRLNRWLQSLCKSNGYASAALFNTKGAIRSSYGRDARKIGPAEHKIIQDVIKRRGYILSDIFTSEVTKTATINLAVPLILWERRERPLVGVFLFRIDPHQELEPLIRSWPTPSPTAETIILRREGNEVIHLGRPRHDKQAGLKLRFPLTDKGLVEVMAAEGVKGLLEGKDYRGVPVAALARKIPNSTWIMVVKVDKGEIYAPLQDQLRVIKIITLLLVIVVLSFLAFWWRHKRAVFYRNQYEVGNKRQALLKHFDYLVQYANDIILLIDNKWRLVEVNEQACRKYGYSREELLKIDIRDLIPPEIKSDTSELMRLVAEKKGMIFETEHVRKDGTRFPVEVSARFFEVEGKRYLQAIIRDITERKKMEEEIRTLSITDSLTGLYNRRGFIALAEQQIRTAHRTNKKLALLFIDLDGLKSINDTFGHEEGDRALAATSKILKQTVRESDIVARIGGDEFAVLVSEAVEKDEVLRQRLNDRISRFNAAEGRRYKISLSVGTAIHDPANPGSLDELMAAADSLMYLQKNKKGETHH